jgi:N-acyl-D-amino-acid deacylase
VLDLVLRNALVVDGTGSPPFHGSLGIQGDRIAWIGSGSPPAAEQVLDVEGACVCPGFVDVHNHSDLSPLVEPDMPNLVRQGITSMVVGNCGSSAWPPGSWEEAASMAYVEPDQLPPAFRTFDTYLEAIDQARPPGNIASLVGHGSIRQEVLGLERRPPSPAELQRMEELVDEAMAAGAIGLSTGLVYVPGMFATTDEIVALARVAGRRGGIYASHIRGEGRDLFDAIGEAIAVGRAASIPVHISHLKCESSNVWGMANRAIAAVRDGGDVTADQYPYTAWNSSLAGLLPPWAPVADVGRIAASDPERLRAAVERGEPTFQSSVNGVGWDNIVLESTANPRWNGTDVAAVAEELGIDPFDAFIHVLREAPGTSCIGHAMHEDDVLAILADPEVMVATDSSACSPTGVASAIPVHPRGYGTFPRALALAREHGLLPLESAIRKMTSLPAERFGLSDRGVLREQAYADLVLFDRNAVRDGATYERPHAFPHGIRAVFVNGTAAWDGGEIRRAGRVLRGRG